MEWWKSFYQQKACSNEFKLVQAHRLQNPKNVIIVHLNVNSLRNKILAPEALIRNKVDIYLFSETILDETFSNQQFKIYGSKLYWRDRNKHGGGVTFYVNENIPCKSASLEEAPDVWR